MLIAGLAIFYAYLHIVLGYFPWTRGLSADLRAIIVAPLFVLAGDVVSSVPSLPVVL
jgi:hypothetical protein